MRFFTRLKNSTKLIRKRFLYRMKMRLKYYLNRQSKDPVFIVATRRSGSNLLLDYLKSIPNTSFKAEILNSRMSYGIRRRFISKRTVLRHIAHSINYSEHRIFGTKLISSQMQTHGIVLQDLKNLFPSVRFIILYRQSLLDQFISLKIAEKTNVWQWIDNGFLLPDSIDIDLHELNCFCGEVKTFYEGILASSWLRERSLIISYEELVSDPHGLFNRSVFPFLDVSASRIWSVTKKQNNKRPFEIVNQYEKLKKLINEESLTQDYSFRQEAVVV